jgi:hypothetical protein
MDEVFGCGGEGGGGVDGDGTAARPLSKLDRVKMFAELLVKSVSNDDHLSVVTFGTVSRVVVPLRRMTEESKKEALQAISSIEVGGVTNMSAGIFAAIDQFNVPFAKSRHFNDNILLFTDGMANEGLTESADLIGEINRRIRTLKDECHFESDYTIKFATLGTGGFLPELLYNVGQTFSSDAFFFLDDRMNMEMDLMTPVLLRQSAAVGNVRVTIDAVNRVLLDRSDASNEYITKEPSSQQSDVSDTTQTDICSDTESYLIHDIATGLSRHILIRLLLPKKHKKILKGKDVLKIHVSYQDPLMCSRTINTSVAYADIPAKDAYNAEPDLLATAVQELRLRATRAIDVAATHVARLDRATARDVLRCAVDQLHAYHDSTMDDLGDESRIELTDWADLLTANVEHCDRLVADLAVRWDDAWGRLKALASSMSREVPGSAGVYADGKELYRAPEAMRERMGQVSNLLREMYLGLGLTTDVLDRYQNVVEELEEKLDERSLYGQSMFL